MLTCSYCKTLVHPKDELLLGEAVFHRECVDVWLKQFGDAILNKEDDPCDDWGKGPLPRSNK